MCRRFLEMRPSSATLVATDVENEKKLGRSTYPRSRAQGEPAFLETRHLFLAVPRSSIKTSHDFLRVLQDCYNIEIDTTEPLCGSPSAILWELHLCSAYQDVFQSRNKYFQIITALFRFNLWCCFLKTGFKLLSQVELKGRLYLFWVFI